MALEIERKFLIEGDFKSQAYHCEHIAQGYLSSAPERSVRIRIKGNKAYITIKGIGSGSGMSRYEWEKEIPLTEAKELIHLCEPGIIDKTRYYIRFAEHVFEVDEFHGENEGLIVAEIELTDEAESFLHPDWLGKEVTGDNRYYNASLVKHPFTKW